MKLSPNERAIVDKELVLHLATVQYESYEYAIKRYGFTGSLTEEGMTEVKDYLNLDTSNFLNN